MRTIPTALQERLHQTFDGRTSFDPVECRLYSHDVGDLPLLIKPLVGNALAAGIVQPHSEQELVELVNLAREHRIPLVPRGKATSGYGGVLPVKGGLTVDFYRLGNMVALDPENMTVTVEPGMVWRNLERELVKEGLALRLYPSSAPSSTVGGWLAQGGYGYGSFEYGAFRDNVASARVVLPTGEVREFAGDLDLISDAEGITGLISQITLRVRPLEDEVVIGARFDSAGSLTAAMQQVVAEKLLLWSVSFSNPTMARLVNQVPPKMEHGYPIHGDYAPQLPEAYLAVFVAPISRAAAITAPLKAIIAANNGELLDDDLTQHEWDERFNIMKVKRLGPSLVPAEILVPLENLGPALAEIESIIKQPLAVEGMILKGKDVLFLGFIPHDARSLLYNMAFGLSLSVTNLAKRHGGRAYASGLYFAREANNVLGADRVRRLREYKAQVDPQGIMNPGKILNPGLMGAFMGLASVLEPLGRPFFNLAQAPVGERPQGAGKRGIPDDIAWYAQACAQCGYCVDNCTQFYGRGWESQSPRGKWFFLREYMAGRVGRMSQEQIDTFLGCTTCEVCNIECPLNLPNESSWLQIRGQLIQKDGRLTFPPFEIMRASLHKEHNIWGAYRKNRADWAAVGIDSLPEKAKVCYFPGCTASYVEQDIAQSTACLLRKAGVEFTYLGEDEACCGIPMLVAGLWDTWEEIMRHNIAAMKKRGVETVIATCPACWLVWKVYYPEWAARLGIDYPFETRHFSEVLADRIQSGDMVFDQPVNMRVTWHDSCHMGRAGGIYEPPREVLKAIPGLEFVEMEHNHEHSYCCGSVLSLVADPAVAKQIGDVRLHEAETVDAEAIVSTCPCCQVQLRVTVEKTGRDLPILDLGALACQASGIPHPDPTAYALNMWATFEAMINLLKPEQMADLMVELFPQMFAAMPGPMVGMMKVARKVPGMLALMKPMMPLMMPMMMPSIMPQVMPDMLKAVEKRVPMSQDMQEQMPDLMPMAMDRLLPNMLPQIMPHIVPPMMDYIENEL